MRGLSRFALTSVILVAGVATASASWNAYKIRGSSQSVLPVINDVMVGLTPAKEFVITLGGQKAGYGTSEMDGMKLGDLLSLSIDRLDDTSRFSAGSGPAVAPYLNMWITSGDGRFAVIANEPSNAEWAGPQKWDMTWDILKTKTVKVYESSSLGWLPNSGVGLKFGDLAGFTIQAPTAAELTAGWSGLGSGAPREIGTNMAYGVNWIFGDTLANYVSGDQGYIVANPRLAAGTAAVPEPFTMGIGAAGLLLAIRARRKARKA
jgi:hypothetical protein